MKKLPPIAYLLECFDLCGDGTLVWRARPHSHFPTGRGWKIFNRLFSGRPAGHASPGSVYRNVRLGGGLCLAHRVVFAIATGRDPWPLEVDHIDGVPLNNSPENLRVATHAQNGANKHVQRESPRGIRRTPNGTFTAQVTIASKYRHLGTFQTAEAAAAAAGAARIAAFGEFA